MPRVKKTENFETSLERLEKIVAKLETGDLPLEDSLKLFEEGIQLTRHCQTSLNTAEEKLKVLTEKNGEAALEDFELTTDND